MMHYISGKWIKGSGESHISKNPSTQAVIWEGRHATSEEVGDAVHSARAAFAKWRSLPFEKRIDYLREYEAALKKRKSSLIETISMETGKPLWESAQEVASIIAKIEVSIEAVGERCPSRQVAENLYTRHKPHGVAAIFGPFNFPGHLPNGHIVPALLAGNTVIFKGSDHAPLVAAEIVKCMEHFPEGVVNLVQGGPSIGSSLALHPQIDALFFTGSHKVGMLLTKAFGHHPEKILALEMGGNNPLIVSEPGDLEAASYLTILSAYLTSGQRCSCARRLILEEGREGEEFLKVLAHMVASIQVGPYTDSPEPFMGPVINETSAESLLNAQAVYGSEGGKSLVEMVQLKKGFPFLTPGLMDLTEVGSRPDEELFGPFLKVIRVPSFDAAIEEANNTAYGLTASLISENREKYRRFYQEARAGIINWNHPTTGASSRAPFGGIGKSGNFRPSGYYAADYCAYPVASMERESTLLPKEILPGITLLAKT
ncbi:MAG: succinylglutamate-semialdehyde dehydrogenase [Chlamydiales bacterium]|nr:succinylglutamate-semialdehyde dehydrogenase [Chlamydiales bacterium]